MSEGGGGRPRGREPTDLEQRHLKLLASLRQRATGFASLYDDQLGEFVLELRDAGCSVRSIADAVGVSSSTVQAWTVAARRAKRQE